MISKEKVRNKALEIRDHLDEGWRLEKSHMIMENVLASELYKRADIILSYSSFRSEVETHEFNRFVLDAGKKLYLPKTLPAKKQLCFYRVEDLGRLKKGYQGILEPEESESAEELFAGEKASSGGEILMIMPGAGFDGNGYRVGYGGGYYDRYLEQFGDCFTSLFIAFYEQKTLNIPVEKCDVKPDYIMTQKGFFV